MRKFALILSTTAFVALGGCATVPQIGPTPGQQVGQVQQLAQQICGFLPTASTVANIFLGGNPLLQSVESVAAAICNAVAPKQLLGRKRAGVPTVDGIVIRGRFTR